MDNELLLFDRLEAIKLAKRQGLNIPIVYNTSSYETKETIKLLNDLTLIINGYSSGHNLSVFPAPSVTIPYATRIATDDFGIPHRQRPLPSRSASL